MQLRAYAKINWSLDAVGVREDGYHLLDMVMQSVELHDTIVLEAANELTLHVGGAARVPENGDNLVLRAAQALRGHAGCPKGAAIHLHKHIPVGAGLGGGSSDAAAVLRGLNEMWRLQLSLEELCRVGLTVGADIPYCLHGVPCRVQGIGEIITPFAVGRGFSVVIIQPCRGLSTRQVFGCLGKEAPTGRPDTQGVMRALTAGSLPGVAAAMGNVLQEVSQRLRPEIRQAISHLRGHGARAAQMTGSGSAVFGVFATAAAARTAWENLRKKYRACYLTHTFAGGAPKEDALQGQK